MTRYDNEVPGEDGLAKSRSVSPSQIDPDDAKFIKCFKDSLKAARDYQAQKLLTPWSRNYRAFGNRHMNGSKYETLRYKNRSKIFTPKTRSAVRKNDATAAGAMFSTEDVVSVTPERSSDKFQTMSAKFLHAVLNYRLDRTNRWAGPNWFMTAIGARQDAQITGLCVSKQYWEYEEKIVKRIVEVTEQQIRLDDTGMPMVDMTTGEPIMEEIVSQGEQDERVVVRDRLMCTLLPAEQVFMDFSADWRDPIQEGGYFIAAYPTRMDDVEHIIATQSERNRMGGGAWRADIDFNALRSAQSDKQTSATAVRRSREQGIDPFEGAKQGNNNDIVWLFECFHRKDGEDTHWWMLGESTILSDPRPTEDAYPAHAGERPYVRGLGALETHRVYPMAPVESWQPSQLEINDITNLSLDALKMGISPITVIKRGAGVDLKQVANRGPDAHVMVNNVEDVSFNRAPSPPPDAMAYRNVLANDFDDLAGTFSQASVQSNRALNETVGGMQLLSVHANAQTEFDLRVWVETWVEPVLAQMLRLIKYYESDAVVIEVAGENAGLIENIEMEVEEGLDPENPQEDGAEKPAANEPKITVADVLNRLDEAQVTVRVNVGIGALDSTQKLGKFMTAIDAIMKIAPMLEDNGTQLNGDAVLQEVMGLSGYRNADQFFTKKKKQEEQPPPEIQKEMLRQKGVMDAKQADGEIKLQIEGQKNELKEREIALAEREQAHQERMDAMAAHMDKVEALLGHITGAVSAAQPPQANRPQAA